MLLTAGALGLSTNLNRFGYYGVRPRAQIHPHSIVSNFGNRMVVRLLRHISTRADSVEENYTFQEQLRVHAVFQTPMRHEFAGEATMSSFHPANERRARPKWTTDAQGRLPRGLALLVTGALSALSWAVLIALFIALRAIV